MQSEIDGLNFDMFFNEIDTRDKRKKVGRRKTPKKDLEAGVVKECMVWLNRRGYYCERRNTGAVRVAQDFLLRFGSPGAADIFAVVDGKHCEIECKRRDGKGRLFSNQRGFRALMEDYRIPYLVVTSAEDLAQQIGALRLHWTR